MPSNGTIAPGWAFGHGLCRRLDVASILNATVMIAAAAATAREHKAHGGKPMRLEAERVNDFETPFVMRLASKRV